QPPRAGGRVEALDRDHIGHAEAGEGITDIALADEAAHVRILRGERLDRLPLAALWVGDVVGHKGARPQAAASPGIEREHRVVTGWPGVEDIDGTEIRLIARQRTLRRRPV